MNTNNWILAGAGLALVGFILGDKIQNYFTPSEWQNKLSQVNDKLPLALNELRYLWGAPITISANAEAITRHGGESDSQHNVDKWGESRAVDFFPSGMTRSQIPRFIGLMQRAGFTGIGVYLDTAGGIMFHGDVRPDRTPDNPATWARIAGRYTGIKEAYA